MVGKNLHLFIMYVGRSDYHSCNNCSAVGPHASLISWDGYYYEVIKIIMRKETGEKEKAVKGEKARTA